MSGVQTLAEGFESYREWVTDPVPRIGFGMQWFDGPTGGGLARSEICMLQAFSSVGKTTVALNIIRNNPAVPALFFSLEMNWRMVAARLAAMEMATSTQDLEARFHRGETVPELQSVADRFRGFICDDTPAIKLRQASESFERATERLGTPPRLVVFDYLELIGGGGLAGKSEQVDKAAATLRDWTRKHDCSTVVLHQVSQGTGGHKPMSMHEGRYGGYQPMDFVAGAYAPRLDPELDAGGFSEVKTDIYFQLLKSRSGAPDPIGKRYTLDPRCMRITPYTLMPSFHASTVSAPPQPPLSIVLDKMPDDMDDDPPPPVDINPEPEVEPFPENPRLRLLPGESSF